MPGKPKHLQNLLVSAHNAGSSVAALVVHTVDGDGVYAAPGGSTQVSIKDFRSTGGSSNVTIMDSTNNSLGVTIRAGSAAGTEYTDGDVDATITGQAILFDNSSGGTLRPVTISRGLPVNLVQGFSTEVTIRQSTFTDLNVRINAPSTANSSNFLPVRLTDGSSYIAPGVEYSDGSTYSTKTGPGLLFDNSSNQTMRLVSVTTPLPVQIRTSSGADAGDSTIASLRVTVSTGSVRVHQSTAADLQVTATQQSTAWSVLARNTTSSGGGVEGSTATPSGGTILGLNVRQVVPTLESTTVLAYIQTAGGSTTVLSSAANPQRHKVFAYSVTSSLVGLSTCTFLSSAAHDIWGLLVGSQSSGVTGANLATSPPGFLFATAANNALQFSATSSGHYRVAVSYFTEA